MKIELDIDNLETTIDGLNNAIIAYSDIRSSIFIMGGVGNKVNKKWEKLVGNDSDTLVQKFDSRLKQLGHIYNQLLEIEKRNAEAQSNDELN